MPIHIRTYALVMTLFVLAAALLAGLNSYLQPHDLTTTVTAQHEETN